MDHQSKVRRCFLIAVFALAVATSPAMAGADEPVLTVTNESRISVNVDNKPLDALLRMMAEKRLFKLSAVAAGNESLTLHFANLTVPEALSKMLRGYNYVVVDQGKGRLPCSPSWERSRRARPPPMRRRPPLRPPALPEPRGYAPPEPAPGPEPATATRGAAASDAAEGQPAGEAGTGRTGGASHATGAGRRIDRGGRQRPAGGQPGGEAQRQAGQRRRADNLLRRAPPAESPGIHF